MNNTLNIVSEIQFTRLDDVTNYQDNFNGTAIVESSNWKTLPIFEGSVRMTVTNTKNASGTLISVDITGRLKNLIQINSRGILEVTMCDGNTYIVGSVDLPVTVDLTTTLTQKTFRISYQNTVFPLKTGI